MEGTSLHWLEVDFVDLVLFIIKLQLLQLLLRLSRLLGNLSSHFPVKWSMKTIN